MDFKDYIKEVDQLYQVGNTTEHSFRGSLAGYLKSLLPKFVVTNEPRRFKCGAPDYVITSKSEPIAFLETKDINDSDLDGRKRNKEQFERYKRALNRIIFTDFLDFHLYLEGEFVDSVRIAETHGNRIVGFPENEAKFNEMIISLATGGRQRITSSSSLARQMAAKAHLLAEAVKKTIQLDGEEGDGEVVRQLRAFRDVLIHDLKADEFADIYAQTIVYGMFTARLNDDTPEDFSRQEAAELIPRSNPFLRKIFQSIAVYDLDDSISWIVDDLAMMFASTDAERIMENYGNNKRHSDPVIHFYEDFLAEYDPKLRKARGVWYTPAPVVKFIVKSVDEILQKEFNLPRGLADDSTIKVDYIIEQSRDKRTVDGMKHEMVDVPRVQILDPATGTGTFLAEVILQIRDKFNGLEGLWPSYVEKNLIPRIYGFEILMASYTIAHLKLSYTLKETGYSGQSKQRLNVFLTNSLEEATPRANNLFDSWLSDEADAASKVKLNTPVMVVLGNPPYCAESKNRGDWITDLMNTYKKEPGGVLPLKERNPKWINDDYCKFIRMAQSYIDKNGEGVLAFINPHGFLDNPTFRGMRWSLLNTFDKIFVFDLHGNAKKKETCPDGAKDENVFDIMQGVSINFFIKSGKKPKGEPASVYHADLYGGREYKYDFLGKNNIDTVSYAEVSPQAPMYFFIPKDLALESEYQKGYSLDKIFGNFNVGVVTADDNTLVSASTEELIANVESKYNISANTTLVKRFAHRVFDFKYIYYDTNLVARSRQSLMKNFIQGDNVAIIAKKGFPKSNTPVFVSNRISDFRYWSCSGMEGGDYVFPLYSYDTAGLRKINMEEEFLNLLKERVGTCITEVEAFNYIYGILHSSLYREKYQEFLKIDFPRIPYPKNAEQFYSVAAKGADLQKIHLMNDSSSWPMKVTFPIVGDNMVDKLSYVDGKIFINTTQYFDNVSELVWNFFIGGYQPAQKWLKDRKGRKLDYQDILHYGHIIYALQETGRLMREIDEIGVI